MEKMMIKSSRVKRLIRRRMQVADDERLEYLQSLVSSMNNRTQIKGLNPGMALIAIRKEYWGNEQLETSVGTKV